MPVSRSDWWSVPSLGFLECDWWVGPGCQSRLPGGHTWSETGGMEGLVLVPPMVGHPELLRHLSQGRGSAAGPWAQWTFSFHLK